MVTLTPIALANSKTNFTGFSISGQTNKNVTNCRVPTKLTFVTSSKDTTPQSIKSTNTTDFSNLYVVDDVSGASYKLINSVVNNYTANLNLYVYHNDTGVDNRVQQILKLINTSASSLMATLVFGLFTLLF
ncbi:hypothetical protein TTHERM_00503890 (macronuclear) [Tetrahymena thermophila SB210]|uniref:Uncharacterized protein n=1 Tax=Tetrahymena thermophila (strain SB210) TaxID=312017 RepID=I7LUM1_TETTS|nr:hypothetical protein TTHERM_00503890 [Tetrahymena thermophila SB210]EAR94943.2 hypothetical protein TTHERM_00503890 [Tetrahymena thermophila SB210]|eukprot:XP_001015188.2 hypothetical protein TTHERM_00503890 [Tetrahymena thermophila SB210]